MVNNQSQLLENKQMREECISRVEVLEQVGELLLLPNTEFATTEQVASYFNVGLEAIQSLIKDNREELINSGFKKHKKDDVLRNIIKGENVKSERTKAIVTIGDTNVIINNTGLNLFPKRAILNVAMLLRDSEVANEIKKKLGIPVNTSTLIRKELKFKNSLDLMVEQIRGELKKSLCFKKVWKFD